MTSKEIVSRSIHFEKPERLPYTGSMGTTDFSGDTVAIFPDMGGKWWLGGGGTDEWGSFWEIDPDHNDMGQVKNIVLEDINDWQQIRIPDALNPERYKEWPEILDRAEKEEKYVVCCNGPFLFERAHFLHGFEATLMDTAIEQEMLEKYLRHLSTYHLKTIQFIEENFKGRIHGYRGTDDWGTQTTSFISPAVFTELFQPIYAVIFDTIHNADMDAWMHSCGQIFDIISLLIDAGLDCINLMQPNVFPIPRLREFRGKVCFEVSGDAQNTLVDGDKEKISSEVQQLLDACCTDMGGLIEVTLDTMYYEGDQVDRETGRFLHNEYRRLDPFV